MDGYRLQPLIENAVRRASDDLVFRTPRSVRVLSVMWAPVWAGASLGVACATSGMLYVILHMALRVPQAVSIGLAAIGWCMMVRLGWLTTTAPLRFRVALRRDTAELGAGLLKCVFPYDSVELIAVADEKEYGVGLDGGGWNAFVRLSPADEYACVGALRVRCSNALFVDRRGEDHVPAASTRPATPLGARYRRHRSLMFAAAYSSLLSGAIGSTWLAALCWQIVAGAQFELAELAMHCAFGVLGVVMCAQLARRTVSCWERMVLARQAMAQVESWAKENENTSR
jgi:hypothetical protein